MQLRAYKVTYSIIGSRERITTTIHGTDSEHAIDVLDTLVRLRGEQGVTNVRVSYASDPLFA